MHVKNLISIAILNAIVSKVVNTSNRYSNIDDNKKSKVIQESIQKLTKERSN